jgi:hypothetical protein
VSCHLHIVCLDAPWPANYGGAIDMLYKIEALHRLGIKIHLHYFSYNQQGEPDELNQYCETINAYQRETGLKGFSRKLPYIVSSRINTSLVENLNKDDYPILLEGVHCTGIIQQLDKNKKIIVRLHNDECEYYSQLAKSTNHLFKKIFYNAESRLLNKYQQSLPQQCYYACITEKDASTFKNRYGLSNTFFSPAFTPYKKISSQEGMGKFCLYHGNLSVPENEKTTTWLLSEVFSKTKIPLVIAGKNPSKKLEKLVLLKEHTSLISNPSATEINGLVKNAHINVLPSFSTTGIKIKLLHALFEGRHCVVNNAMIVGTGLETACHIGTNPNAIVSIITQLYHQPFTEEEIMLRKKLLEGIYDTTKNAERLSQYLY